MTASSTPALASGRSPALSPIARLRAWYAACAPRERRMLVFAVAVMLGGALISTAEQLAAERERLARSLPAARLAYLGMEQDAAGLAALRERGAEDLDWVLVHDAARCLLQPAWVQRLIDAVADDAVGGLLALPVADTVKREEGSARVEQTIPRDRLWLAQTPQMFRLALLQRALAQAGAQVTDEASAVEALGLRPLLVPGAWENLKITWPADFALAERLLATR